jgi:hypothetical protein
VRNGENRQLRQARKQQTALAWLVIHIRKTSAIFVLMRFLMGYLLCNIKTAALNLNLSIFEYCKKYEESVAFILSEFLFRKYAIVSH